ncbi:MAG TPA: glutamine synthetase family protein [Acidobacteriota bacterium]|nr:glutamine synthetase family protein [Acidobacteriota bacterium]
MTLESVLEQLEKGKIKRIKVGVTDIDGILRGKYVSLEKFTSAASSGMGFCDVVFGWDIGDVLYDAAKFTGWHTGYPDVQARIDLGTMRRIPWEEGTAFFLADLYKKDGEPLSLAPRQVFRSVLGRVESSGYNAHISAEYEFWFFRETADTLREKNFRKLTALSPGMFGYSVLRASQNAPFVLQLIEQLSAFGIPLEGFHTETGPGVYEAAVEVDAGLAAADKATLFKTAVKEIAARHGLTPTFMAKWSSDLPGSSGHLHQSLWDRDGRTNLFFAGKGDCSRVMQQYTAGLVHYIPELMAMYCPTINSYKRTVPGTWAPVNATWGEDNRTTAVRTIPGNSKSTRVEMRLTGADINPYLAMAASLASGTEGIKRQMQLPPPTTNAYAATDAPSLPRNLAEATRLLRESAMARDWFGEEFVEHYAITREWEIRQYEKAVTDWELLRYFESV